MDWIRFPPNSCVEALTLHVTMLELGSLRRWWKLNKVIRMKPWSNRTGTLIRRGRVTSTLSHRKRLLTRTQPCWHHDLKLPASRNCGKYIFVVQATQSMIFYDRAHYYSIQAERRTYAKVKHHKSLQRVEGDEARLWARYIMLRVFKNTGPIGFSPVCVLFSSSYGVLEKFIRKTSQEVGLEPVKAPGTDSLF